MAYKRISKEDAIKGRKLKSFVLSAGYFPTVKFGGKHEWRVGMYQYGRSPPKHHFVTVEGVNVMGGEPITESAWKLSGNHVWYQYGGKLAVEGQSRLQQFIDLENKKGNAKSSMKKINDLMMDQGKSFSEEVDMKNYSKFYGDAPWDLGEPSNPVQFGVQMNRGELREKEFFKKLYRVFAYNANKESLSFLSNLNKQLRHEVKKSLTEAGGVSANVGGETVTVTAGSRMSEEQARVSEFGRPQDHGIGATEPMDTTYYTIGGNIYIDVSDMPISQGGQHGIGEGGIQLKSKHLTEAEEGNFTNVRNTIYEHFQERIGVFNTTIARIRHNAQELAGRNKVSAEEMRRAGFSGNWNKSGKFTQGTRYKTAKGGMAPALAHRRNLKNKTINNASATANAVMANLMTTGALEWSDKSAVDFTLHALGTYNNHQGDYYHGMTVKHDPHITASVRFRMFAEDHASRAFEYRKLNKKRDVIVSFGYASLEILRRRNMLNSANYVNHVKKMKDIHAGARYLKGVRKITLNGIQHGKMRGGKQFDNSTCKISGTDKVIKKGGFGSAAIHIPQGWSDEAIDNAIRLLSKDGGFRPAQQGQFAHQNKLQTRLTGLQEDARENGFDDQKVHWPKQVAFWATPYYGYARYGGLDKIGD
tara:strand:- start:761 stop:2695 length:1935 start_codon:yes stop_codon:yes gene_type:complete